LRRFPSGSRIAPNWRAFVLPLGLYFWPIGFRCPFRRFGLLASKSRFPENGDSRPRRLVRIARLICGISFSKRSAPLGPVATQIDWASVYAPA